MPLEKDFIYEELSKETRRETQAGLGYYDFNFFNRLYPRVGMSREQLGDCFHAGILQYYVATITHYDFAYNYKMSFSDAPDAPEEEWWRLSEEEQDCLPLGVWPRFIREEQAEKSWRRYDEEKFTKLSCFFQKSQVDFSLELGAVLGRNILPPLMAKIKDLTLLRACGAYFEETQQSMVALRRDMTSMKNKTGTKEFCEGHLEFNQREQLILDKKLECIQRLIYNWVRYFYEEVRSFLKSRDFDIDRIKEDLDAFTPQDNPIDDMNIPPEEKAELLAALEEVQACYSQSEKIAPTLPGI